MFNPSRLIAQLERFADVLPAVVAGIPHDDFRWRPVDGAWSILEIVCHLLDEEREDFRERIRLTLMNGTTPWPPIDPEGAAVERRYNERSPDEAVREFVAQRRASIEWLNGLAAPDWTAARNHPQAGTLHAADLLASWAAHDALHLRQIAKRLHQIAGRDAGPYTTAYAGEWRV